MRFSPATFTRTFLISLRFQVDRNIIRFPFYELSSAQAKIVLSLLSYYM